MIAEPRRSCRWTYGRIGETQGRGHDAQRAMNPIGNLVDQTAGDCVGRGEHVRYRADLAGTASALYYCPATWFGAEFVSASTFVSTTPASMSFIAGAAHR